MPFKISKLKLSAASLPYLLLQRTHFDSPGLKGSKPGFSGKLYQRSIGRVIEPMRLRRRLENLYTADIQRDYETLKDYLPNNALAALDIGCGLGGINVFLYKHYQANGINLHLLDKDGIASKVYYGFNPEGAHYNSLALTGQFLRLNGVPDDRVTIHNVTKEGFPNRCKFDIVVSLLSWGYHYPVSTYVELVKASLNPDGIVIMDIRNGTDGKDQLARHFSVCREIFVGLESNRRTLATNRSL